MIQRRKLLSFFVCSFKSRIRSVGIVIGLMAAFQAQASTNQIERAGLGCPDETCVWMVGEGFGTQPAVELRSGPYVWTIPYAQLAYYRREFESDSITLSVPRIEQLIQLDNAGLDVTVVNNQTLTRSNTVRVTRTLPKFQFRNSDPLLPFEAGGTAFTVTSLATQPNTFLGVRTLVGWFHEQRQQVLADLEAMYAGGQRKLSIVIWYTLERLPDCRGQLSLEIRDGTFCAQYMQNLVDIVQGAKAIGFNEVVVRFANLGNVAPGFWTQLDQNVTRQVSSAIQAVRDRLVSAAPNQSGFRIRYDLCLECAGLEQGMLNEYILALYDAYVTRNGVQDTYVASVAYYPGRLKSLVNLLRSSGRPLPPEFGVDIYERSHSETDLFRLQQELETLDLQGHPVSLLEAFYNSPTFSQSIFRARSVLRLNIRTVFQWQLRSPQSYHFDVAPPVDFQSYRELVAPIEIVSISPLKGSPLRRYMIEHTGGTDCAAVEVYSTEGLQELIEIVPGIPMPSESSKSHKCLFAAPASSRVSRSPIVRVVGMNGGLSPVVVGR